MKRTEATILTVIALIGSLTAIPLPLGDSVYVPFIVLFGLTGYLCLLHWRELTARDLVFLSGCFILLTANILFSNIQGFQHQMKALLQLIAAFGFAVFIPKLCLGMGIERMRTVFAWTLCLILLLAFAERLGGPVRELSDSWRHFIFENSGYTDPYTSDLRDLDMVGFIRPKVFSAEPAHLSGFIFLCITCLSLLIKRRSRLLILVIANILAWILIGSPILILSMITLSGIILYKCRGYFIYFTPVILLLALAITLNPPTAFKKAYQQIETRFSGILKGEAGNIEDDSIRSRLYIPFAISIPNAISYNPIWGVGIGGKEKLSEMIDPNYSRYSEGIGSTEQTLGTNALGSMLSTLGIVGFMGLLGLIVWYWAHVGAEALLISMGAIFLLLFSRGAYETQSFWLAVFLIIGAAGLFQNSRPNAVTST